MNVMEFFSPREVFPLGLLIVLLRVVGGQMAGDSKVIQRCAQGGAAAAFLLYAGCGLDYFRPAEPVDYLDLTFRAVLAMGVAHGVVRVTMPAAHYLYVNLWAEPVAQHRAWAAARARKEAHEKQTREEAEEVRAEQQRLADHVQKQREEVANRPPPPSREERLAAAKEQYEATIRMLEAAGLDDIELRAASRKAKQSYLREVDRIMG